MVETLVYLGFTALGAVLGWQWKAGQVEREAFRREEERDRAWDATHGVGGTVESWPPVSPSSSG